MSVSFLEVCMCTVLTLEGNVVGRNLDLSYHYNEELVLCGRNVELEFRFLEDLKTHYAFMGVATRIGGRPMFYEAINEHGLFVAGLNFPNNCKYGEVKDGCLNLCPFELIPYLLGSFKTVEDVKKCSLNLVDEVFMDGVLNAPLHFYVSDGVSSIVVECMEDGMHVHEDPYFVMSNNPPFEYQMEAMKDLSSYTNAYQEVDAVHSCVGHGAYGLLGDSTSTSRFMLAAFLRKYVSDSSVSSCMRILDKVSMVKGSVVCQDGSLDYTVYSTVYDGKSFTMYYKLYDGMCVKKCSLSDGSLDLSEYVFEAMV